jgi:hypothetical protein
MRREDPAKIPEEWADRVAGTPIWRRSGDFLAPGISESIWKIYGLALLLHGGWGRCALLFMMDGSPRFPFPCGSDTRLIIRIFKIPGDEIMRAPRYD